MIRQTSSIAASCFILTASMLAACSSSNHGTSGSSNSPGCSSDGTWAVSFQWSGRTPGELTLVTSGSLADQESGPGVGAASGTISKSGDEVSWTLSDGSTWSGTLDSSCTSIPTG